MRTSFLFSASRRFARLRGMFSVIAAVALVVGCNRSDRLPTYAVSGRVILPDGSPVGPGTIIFESHEHAMAARGTIHPDGSFTLGTYEEDDGAVAGLHTATVIPAAPDDFDPDTQPYAPPPIDQRYMHPDTSGLEFEVKEQGPNRIDVVVQRSR